MTTEKHNITLYCEGTPNPLKISIALEELGLKYNVRNHHGSASHVEMIPDTILV